MPRPRFLKLAQEKQEAILQAARSEFADKGFDGASYNRIIELAGLSKGAMYYYFDDKLDVYVTVLEQVNEQMTKAMGIDADWKPEGDFWPAVREFAVRAMGFALEHPELATLVKGIGSLPRQVKREGRLAPLYRFWRSLMERMLLVGQTQGKVRTDLPLELLVEISVALDEALDFWLLDHMDELTEEMSVEAIVDMSLELWRRLMAP